MKYLERASEILALRSQYPEISFDRAVEKLRDDSFRTVARRNGSNEWEIFLCLASGVPLFRVRSEEVRR